MSLQLPFVGRGKEAARLQQLHAQRKHVLILGPAGVGKSALIRHAACCLPLLVCPQSERLSGICTSLEAQLGLCGTEQRLPERKRRLLRAVTEMGKTVVFDAVGWTTPKLSAFLGCVSQRVPVWIATRSEHSWDIGHFWTLLVRFARLELHPFHLAETRALVAAAVGAGQVPDAALDAIKRLHHLAAGLPRVLCELLDGLAKGRYDPHRRFDLKLLDLDRRIEKLLVADESGTPLER